MARVRWTTIETFFPEDCKRVPKHIEALASDRFDEAWRAYRSLRTHLVRDLDFCDAKGPALDLLLHRLHERPHPFGALSLALAAQIVAGDSLAAWLADDPVPTAEGRDVSAQVDALRGTLASALPIWCSALSSASDPVRCAAPMVLLGAPEVAAALVDEVVWLAREDPSRVVRASAVVALAPLSSRFATASQAIDTAVTDDPDPAVRGAAELARWRAAPADAPFDLSSGGLIGWLALEDGGADTGWEWFGYERYLENAAEQVRAAQANAVIQLARRRNQAHALCSLALRAAQPSHLAEAPIPERSMPRARRQLEVVLREVGGFADVAWKTSVPTRDDCTTTQRETIDALAHSPLFPSSAYGIPASGVARLRWSGLAEPGLLERTVSVEHEGRTLRGPLWRVAAEVAESRRGGVKWPPALAEQLSLEEDIYALMHLWRYGVTKFNAYLTLPRLGVDLSAPEVLDALGDALDEHLAGPSPQPFGMVTVMVPWLDAGRSLPERWDPLIEVYPAASTWRVLDALPPGRRDAVIARLCRVSKLDHLLKLFEARPDERLARWIWEAVAALEKGGTSPEYCERSRKAIHEGLARGGLQLELHDDPWSPTPFVVDRDAKPLASREHERPPAANPPPDLSFARHRHPFRPDAPALPQRLAAQVRLLVDELGVPDLAAAMHDDPDLMATVELVDIVETDGGRCRYQLWLYGGGDGFLFRDGTGDVVTEFVQHHPRDLDPFLAKALARADRTAPLDLRMRWIS